MLKKFIYISLVSALVNGCSSIPLEPQQKEKQTIDKDGITQPLQRKPTVRAPSRSNGAITVLLVDAKTAMKQGKYRQAAAYLERALRIEPKNALVWHHLATVRLNQGRYGQAANLAARSNSLARGQSDLIEKNRQIIQRAKRSGR